MRAAGVVSARLNPRWLVFHAATRPGWHRCAVPVATDQKPCGQWARIGPEASASGAEPATVAPAAARPARPQAAAAAIPRAENARAHVQLALGQVAMPHEQLLQLEQRFVVVAEGSTAAEAVTLAERHRPQIMTLDLSMGESGLDVIAPIRAASPETRIIILTASGARRQPRIWHPLRPHI